MYREDRARLIATDFGSAVGDGAEIKTAKKFSPNCTGCPHIQISEGWLGETCSNPIGAPPAGGNPINLFNNVSLESPETHITAILPLICDKSLHANSSTLNCCDDWSNVTKGNGPAWNDGGANRLADFDVIYILWDG